MESVATFMIVLIMNLMPHMKYMKLCVFYKHGAITYNKSAKWHYGSHTTNCNK